MNAVKIKEKEMKSDSVRVWISLLFIVEPLIKTLHFEMVTNFDFSTVLNNVLSHNQLGDIYQYWVLFPMFGFALGLYNSKRFLSLAIMSFAIFQIFVTLNSFTPYSWPYLSATPNSYSVVLSFIGIGVLAYSFLYEFSKGGFIAPAISKNINKRNKVLLVDDDENYISLCKSYLEGIGYQVKTAQDGLHALTLASEDHFNLILMDIQMPVMNGQLAGELLKKDARTKNIPIVGMSSSTSLALNMEHFKDKFSKSQGLGVVGKRIHHWVER